jgi:GxxExxY protein
MEAELIEGELTETIIGAAIEVHRYWGPGLYEDIYEKSLCRELSLQGLRFQRQIKLPLIYKDEQVGDDLQLDVWVEGKVVVENKHVKELLPIHEAQLITYLKLTKCRVGLLFNFRSKNLTNSMKRIVL